MVKKILILLAAFLSGVDGFFVPTSSSKAASTALFYRNDETEVGVAETPPVPAKERKPAVVPPQPKKPTIYSISNLDELYEFLQEDDDRLTAIKIHAAWCKSCQRVGHKFKKLAVDFGDYVQNGKALEGDIRCAHIEFAVGVTSHFIHEQLQVKSLPTLQLYKGTKKLWQASGHQSIKVMEAEVKHLLSMSPQDLQDYVDELEDDGLLQEAIEESFFDNAYVE